MEGGVDKEGFGEGFREGFVPLMSVDYLKHPVLTILLSGGADYQDPLYCGTRSCKIRHELRG
jgi:hypothetical protein